MQSDQRIRIALLLLRISIFAVMLVWTLDKFIAPKHAASVFARFYFLPDLTASTFMIIGAVQLAIIVCFFIGFHKRLSAGLVLAMHTVSTLSSTHHYIHVFQPGTNLLFWAAWPMLAACVVVYMLRDLDTLWSLGSRG